LRVLVVDDSAYISGALRAILEEDGYRVTVAEGGQAAIDALLEAECAGDRFAAQGNRGKLARRRASAAQAENRFPPLEEGSVISGRN